MGVTVTDTWTPTLRFLRSLPVLVYSGTLALRWEIINIPERNRHGHGHQTVSDARPCVLARNLHLLVMHLHDSIACQPPD